MLCDLNIPLVGTLSVRVKCRDTKRLEALFQLQEDVILTPSEHRRQHLPGAVINGVPKLAWLRFPRHIGPHFVELRAQPTTPSKLILTRYLHSICSGFKIANRA